NNFNFTMLSKIKHYNEENLNLIPNNNLHNANIQSLSLSFKKSLNWSAFSIWLSMLLHKYGSQVLRVKGLLDIGEEFLVNINGVGHIIYPPNHIKKTKEQKKSYLVFISKNLEIQKVLSSLQSFLNLNSNELQVYIS
ncbi:MAG: GTP-binding protein, partial [Campylobacter sp.]|nr:GTP-binding protein [Campylobacter sp.]